MYVLRIIRASKKGRYLVPQSPRFLYRLSFHGTSDNVDFAEILHESFEMSLEVLCIATYFPEAVETLLTSEMRIFVQLFSGIYGFLVAAVLPEFEVYI